MSPQVRRFAGYVGLAGALALTGCSSSGGGDHSTAGGSVSQSTPAGAHQPDAATERAIRHAYLIFFDSAGTTAQGVATLQHGARFRSTIDTEGKSNYGKQKTSAKVSAVKLISANVADVTFSIVVGGQTLLPNSKGFAVREAGKWKVAAQTFCALLQLEGTAPALCSNKSITALPS